MKNTKKMSCCILMAFLLSLSIGCKGANDKLLDSGIEKFESGNAKGASEDFLNVIKNDQENLKAKIKYASAEAYLNSDYKLFLRNISNISLLDSRFKDPFNFIDEAVSQKMIGNLMRNTRNTMGSKVDVGPVKDEIQDVTNAINKNPSNPYFYFVRALWNSHFYSFEEAEADMSKAIELKKDFWQAIFLRGRFRDFTAFQAYKNNVLRNNLMNVIDLNKVKAINPDDSTIDFWLYFAAEKLGGTEENLETVDRLYKKDTTKIFYLVKRTELLVKKGEHLKAIEGYRLLLKKDTDNINYFLGLSTATIAAGRKQEGIMILKDALVRCTNKRDENRIMRAMENAAENKSGAATASNKDRTEFIKLYLTAQDKLKEGKNEEGIALLKKAEPLAINRYYKSRISTLLRDEKRREEREERNKIRQARVKPNPELNITKDSKGLVGYRERNYLQGKTYIENGKYEVGIRKLKIALTRTSDKTIQKEIKLIIERAEKQKRASDNSKVIKNTEKNYKEHYYISGKQKLAEGKTKEGIEELKMAYKVCPRSDIKREIKELLHKADKN